MSNNKFILTPKVSDLPRINSPEIFGVRPGNPLYYIVSCTGIRPIKFYAENLPNGVTINENTGIITGTINKKGCYEFRLFAQNKLGTTKKEIKIVVGDEIALTPPMGWNHWNCWGPNIDEEKVRKAADNIISSGLKDHGFIYINIDDGWQGKRDSESMALQPNERFKDMKSLCDYIHGLGLKVGIYSTPWKKSYAGYIGGSADTKDGQIDDKGDGHQIGKYRFEDEDAKQWAEWGIDYLKYDWYPNDIQSTKRMYDALRKSGRDIILSLSNTAPFDIMDELTKYAQCWRITGDIEDAWDKPEKSWSHSIKEIGFSETKWIPYCRGGHWNDMDMLVVGNLGWGDLRPTKLTADEQYAHITQWCIMSSPLLLGCDLASLDEFTLNLLSNDEVLEINQDPLGVSGRLLKESDGTQIWVKDLKDGSKALGLFNLNDVKSKIIFDIKDVGCNENFTVRDLWRQIDEGIFKDKYSCIVNPHGVKFIKITES